MLHQTLIQKITGLGLTHSIEGNADTFKTDTLEISVRIVHGKPMMYIEIDCDASQSLILAVGNILREEISNDGTQFNLHPETRELVIQFSADLSQKLLKSQLKYGLDRGWRHPPSRAEPGDGRFFMSEEQCNAALLNHLKKGDIIDVAAYLAFMNANGWSIDTTMF